MTYLMSIQSSFYSRYFVFGPGRRSMIAPPSFLLSLAFNSGAASLEFGTWSEIVVPGSNKDLEIYTWRRWSATSRFLESKNVTGSNGNKSTTPFLSSLVNVVSSLVTVFSTSCLGRGWGIYCLGPIELDPQLSLLPGRLKTSFHVLNWAKFKSDPMKTFL